MPMSRSSLRRWCTTLAAGLLALAAPLTQADTYPSKPLRWIVGYPAGGGSDVLARAIGNQLSAQLGQPVLIDNRPGAASNIGADLAAKSAGDGYTVFTADNGVLIYNPVLYKKLSYDAARDLSGVGLMARAHLLIVAAPTADIKNASQLLSTLKTHPGRYNYASPGNGSPHHLAMELFKSRTGLFVVHVPYRGAAPALQDVMGGQVPLMMVDSSSAIGPIKAGKLIPLVVMSGKRMAQLPDVPTLAELGYKDAEAYAWQSLVVPASTPKDLQARLGSELHKALANPEVRKKMADIAWDPIPADAAQMAAYVASESKLWHKLIKERGITLD